MVELSHDPTFRVRSSSEFVRESLLTKYQAAMSLYQQLTFERYRGVRMNSNVQAEFRATVFSLLVELHPKLNKRPDLDKYPSLRSAMTGTPASFSFDVAELSLLEISRFLEDIGVLDISLRNPALR